MKKEMVIGIVGGMGSYATVDFFERIIDAFPAEKEWDRPRVIIDNRCTMPSRVRAVLYDEKVDELIDSLTSSTKGLIEMGANRIIFACNTSHIFQPEVIKKLPGTEDCFINIIDELGREMTEKGIKKAALAATEGTIITRIYSDTLSKYGIEIIHPTEDDFTLLREFIESVKVKTINSDIEDRFIAFINSFDTDAVILGCTELPILYKACCQDGKLPDKEMLDPLQSVINRLVCEKNE